eukprot:11939345-Alexandrium_andersonii.AAC.2
MSSSGDPRDKHPSTPNQNTLNHTSMQAHMHANTNTLARKHVNATICKKAAHMHEGTQTRKQASKQASRQASTHARTHASTQSCKQPCMHAWAGMRSSAQGSKQASAQASATVRRAPRHAST